MSPCYCPPLLSSKGAASPVVLIDHQSVGRPARGKGVGQQAAGRHHSGGHGGRNGGEGNDWRPADPAVIPQSRVHAGPGRGDGREEVDHVLR